MFKVPQDRRENNPTNLRDYLDNGEQTDRQAYRDNENQGPSDRR